MRRLNFSSHKIGASTNCASNVSIIREERRKNNVTKRLREFYARYFAELRTFLFLIHSRTLTLYICTCVGRFTM